MTKAAVRKPHNTRGKPPMSHTKTLKMTSSTGPTIRTVPSFDGNEPGTPTSATSDQDPPSSATTRSSASTAATPALDTNMATFTSSGSINGRLRGASLDPASARNGAPSQPQQSAQNGDATSPTPAPASQEATSPGGWDSTIGKAGLGKTGRVINKLVDENETLKRDIKLERLRAEEARQAAKLVEDKMERSVAEYESRLLEASVARTLLARKERQLEELNANIERQRQRADAAQERERNWRDELEKLRTQSTQQVEAANSHAELMEGRYNVLASQWGTHDVTIQKLRDEIKAVQEERLRDDERIATLHDLCDQQDSNIRHLRAEKEKIGEQFEAYKRAQEDGLRSIKDKACKQEEAQEKLLEETREALHKLRWALQVNEHVKDSQ